MGNQPWPQFQSGIRERSIEKQKNLKVHPLIFEKLFNGIERKPWSELSEWTSK